MKKINKRTKKIILFFLVVMYFIILLITAIYVKEKSAYIYSGLVMLMFIFTFIVTTYYAKAEIVVNLPTKEKPTNTDLFRWIFSIIIASIIQGIFFFLVLLSITFFIGAIASSLNVVKNVLPYIFIVTIIDIPIYYIICLKKSA